MTGEWFAVTFRTLDGVQNSLGAVGAGVAVTMKIDSFIHKRSPDGARFGSAVQRGP
jgi:hypothetical protein